MFRKQTESEIQATQRFPQNMVELHGLEVGICSFAKSAARLPNIIIKYTAWNPFAGRVLLFRFLSRCCPSSLTSKLFRLVTVVSIDCNACRGEYLWGVQTERRLIGWLAKKLSPLNHTLSWRKKDWRKFTQQTESEIWATQRNFQNVATSADAELTVTAGGCERLSPSSCACST